jgi:hypothetical protein
MLRINLFRDLELTLIKCCLLSTARRCVEKLLRGQLLLSHNGLPVNGFLGLVMIWALPFGRMVGAHEELIEEARGPQKRQQNFVTVFSDLKAGSKTTSKS